ncbi:MAG: hypothetical protein EOM50_19740 [Erysipelotrichia bacterium]|nr:hypothetical protein [Erysipelotrichia bacterium]
MAFLKKRTINSNAENNDGHYYISISDLMTSLLFVFILILTYVMLSFVQEKEEYTAKKESLSLEIKKLETNLNNRSDLLMLLQKELIEQHNIFVEIDEKNGNFRLKSDLLFEKGSAEISQEGRRQITEIAKILYLKFQDEKYRSSIDTVFIEGHTDNDPIKSISQWRKEWSNKELSAQRAINTYLRMVEATDSKIALLKNNKEKTLFSYSGYAETRPLCLDETVECKGKNRRIELYFTVNTPDISKAKIMTNE